MKIAIVTLYGKDNLGNRLQHYALQEAIEKKCDPTGSLCVVNYVYDMPNSYPAVNYCKVIIKRMMRFLGVKKYSNISLGNHIKYEKRAKRFADFTSIYIKNRKKVRIGHLTNNEKQIDAAVVGSDQVWHHWGFTRGELEYFYLEFLDPSKRISYAASFGFSSIPRQDYDVHCAGLKNMRFLSCREESMVGIINDAIGRKAKLVLDPTFLLDKEEWDLIEKKPSIELPEKYVLVYYLGNKTGVYESVIGYLHSKYGCQVVDIYDIDSPFYYTTPDEFIYLIRNAIYVVTDSFHGTVFSILNHKKFWVVKRDELYMEDMFDRINSLVNIFDIRDVVLDDDRNLFEPPNIDYEKVESILGRFRQDSIEFLSSSIMECVR